MMPRGQGCRRTGLREYFDTSARYPLTVGTP